MGGAVPQTRTDALEDRTPMGMHRASRTRWGTLWQIPLLGAVVLGWGVFLFTLREERVSRRNDSKLAAERVIQAYEAGEDEKAMRDAAIFAEVYPMADELADVQLHGGLAAVRLAERMPKGAARFHTKAAVFAKAALRKGLEDPKRLVAEEMLGRSYLEGGDWQAAAEVLGPAYKRSPEQGRYLLLWLAKAEFGLGRRDAAEQAVKAYLQGPDLTDDQKVDAYLQLGEGCRLTGALGEAEESFRRVICEFPMSAKLKETWFALARTLREKARGRPELLDEAKEEFEKVVGMLPPDRTLDRKAGYFVGECLYEREEYKRAAEEFGRIAASYGGTPEGAAATLRLASILVSEGRFDEAREVLGGVVTQIPERGPLENEYVSSAEIDSIWKAVLGHYAAKGEWEKLEKTKEDASSIAGSGVYVIEQGNLLRRAAEGLWAEAGELRGRGLLGEAAKKEEEARADFKQAARLFVQVVRDVACDKESHANALKQACDCLDGSGDYADAAVYYRLLLKSTGEPEGIAATRLRYAKVLQTLGRHREALRELDRCISSCGNAPSVYEAMLAKAQSWIALGDFENAEKTLSDIVCRDDALSPTSRIWGQALVQLGYVLYREGKFRQATERLDEALSRKASTDSCGFSRREVAYYLAESYRNTASAQFAARRDELSAAARSYAEVHESGENEASVSPFEDRMIRRSCACEADCRYELGEYEAALRLYEHAAEKYLDTAEGVGSLFGIAACLHQLGDVPGAAEACRRARWSLDTLKEDEPGEVPRFLEECWEAMVAWSTPKEGSQDAASASTQAARRLSGDRLISRPGRHAADE